MNQRKRRQVLLLLRACACLCLEREYSGCRCLSLSRFLQPLLLVLDGCRRCCWPWSEPSRLDVSPVRRELESCRSRCLLCAMFPPVEHSVARAGRLESESVPIETLVLAIGVSCAGRSVGQFEGVEAEVRRLGERKVEEVGCTRAELYFTGLRGTHERTGVLETTPREKRSRASSRPCRVDGFQAARLMGIRRQGWWREHYGTDCCAICFVCMEEPSVRPIKCRETSDAGPADASDCCSRRRLLRFPANDCKCRYGVQLHTLVIGWSREADAGPRLSCLLSGRDVDLDACAYVKRPERSHAGDDVIQDWESSYFHRPASNVRHATKRPRQPTTTRAAATPRIWLPNRLFCQYDLRASRRSIEKRHGPESLTPFACLPSFS
ncbi:hypothetical protein BDP55DRAFT_627273 [Colletotrichum godetiae]|uniref:Secreted protein n=1 Tax=Colletotrichum godetiae TaxID=1209918 RepID=A0AAJ0F3L9_9PEZI|nr:uncharacterized protein BDP55DRAFT_627273 [Colletotrichum godetiae]KAK1691648.1 hypothetical protein BDP55DRAFT_627273 [Colletotrichum godetiae]